VAEDIEISAADKHRVGAENRLDVQPGQLCENELYPTGLRPSAVILETFFPCSGVAAPLGPARTNAEMKDFFTRLPRFCSQKRDRIKAYLAAKARSSCKLFGGVAALRGGLEELTAESRHQVVDPESR